MILLGAWAHSLEKTSWIKYLAIGDEWAKPVMKAKVRELCALIGAFGLLILDSATFFALNNTIDVHISSGRY
jgi:hypothetical protein